MELEDIPNRDVEIGWKLYSMGKELLRKEEEPIEEHFTWIHETLEGIRAQMAV